MQNFRASIARQSQISFARAFKDAAEAPAPRFWVSEARATRIISLMLKGENPLDGMRKEKREMYLEIFSRVKVIRESNPGLPLGDIVFEVVNSEAPRSYIHPAWAQRLILNEKHKRI